MCSSTSQRLLRASEVWGSCRDSQALCVPTPSSYCGHYAVKYVLSVPYGMDSAIRTMTEAMGCLCFKFPMRS